MPAAKTTVKKSTAKSAPKETPKVDLIADEEPFAMGPFDDDKEVNAPEEIKEILKPIQDIERITSKIVYHSISNYSTF